MTSGATGRWSPVAITAEDTHDLRRRVLRAGTPSQDLIWTGDHDSTTTHLGVVEDGRLIGVVTLLGAGPKRQFRGMAVEPERQGEGIGRALVEAAAQRAADAGANRLWANARDTALGFYLGLGMEVVGDGFVTADTGVPHHRVEIALPLRRR